MRCEECGFDDESVSALDAAETVRRFGRRYRAPLTRLLPGESADVVRRQPDPATWSALQYAAHVRDLIAFWGSALHKTLTEDRPALTKVSQEQLDELASSYAALDAARVADELAANADRLATKVEKVGAAEWERRALFGEDEMTALDIVRKVAHEGNHHLLDIGRALRAARGR